MIQFDLGLWMNHRGFVYFLGKNFLAANSIFAKNTEYRFIFLQGIIFTIK